MESNFVRKIHISTTSKVRYRANELAREQADFIDLASGELACLPPRELIDEVKYASETFSNKYVDAAGLPKLRNNTLDYISRHLGLQYDYAEVLITSGAKSAIFNLLTSIINPGDEVMIYRPYWSTYINQVLLLGGAPIIIESGGPAFEMALKDFKENITNRTKVLILNIPTNPTGKCCDALELEKILITAKERSILVIMDICYHQLILYPEYRNLFSSLSNYKNEVVIVDSFSKPFAITGWRIGYIAANREIISTLRKLISQTLSNANSLAQHALAKYLERDYNYFLTKNKENMRSNLNIFLNTLKSTRGISFVKPASGIYLFGLIDLESTIENGNLQIENIDEFCEMLLSKYRVMVTPGTAFGITNGIRITLTGKARDISSAARKIKLLLKDIYNR